jgi:adenine phosphoribosyltransferase
MAIDPAVLQAHVRDIPDWPEPGVLFRDITPLVNDVAAYRATVDALAEQAAGRRIDRVTGIEARGFIFGAPVAYALGAGFVPVRKPGKLPYHIEKEEYALEYGRDGLEIHVDAIRPAEQVLIVDDVLATGGTAAATARLVERLGGEVVALAFVLEIAYLGGRARLADREVRALATYE